MEEKRNFKMPHLLWIMVGLILISCFATYIVSAGKFLVNDFGIIMGDKFEFLGHQTPGSPWKAFNLIRSGLIGSATIRFVVMVSGANINVVLETGAIDDFMNWSIYRMRNHKSKNILISLLFVLMAYLGGFGGTDALIAVVPIGILFAKKLKLDPIVALGVTTFATLIGCGTGPAQQATTQMLMGIAPYSSFFTRFICMNFFIAVGIIMVLLYVKKIEKNPKSSLMYDEGWRPEKLEDDTNETSILKEVKMSWRTIVVIAVFFCQYLLIVAYPLLGGDPKQLYDFMMAVMFISMIIIGFVGKMTPEELGKSFAKGLSSMAFVGFVIGLARVISLILADGNIIHTIVYVLTRPLLELPKTVSSIGVTIIVALMNPLIPSATSKAAILVPIITPVAETLGLNLNIAVMAFQLGDGFTNLISPLLGWMIGSCVLANVSFQKWFKWTFPKVIIFLLLSFVWIYVLTIMGWTGRI